MASGGHPDSPRPQAGARDESHVAASARPAWHADSVAQACQQLQVDAQQLAAGLAQDEARQRLQQYGPNRLAPPKRRSAWLRFVLQFHNILLYVMMVAALVTALLGHWVDTGVLLAAVLVNAIIGFIQEGKAEAALDAIRGMLSLQAMVVRDGQRQVIDAEALVPGDLVLLASGDRVPADLRLVAVTELRVEEAALTGESLPVEKQTEAVPADASLGDRSDMAFSGTLVVYGQARGLVVGTGSQTELGHINTMLSNVDVATTPLLRQINGFGHKLALVILVMAVLTFVLGTWLRGIPATEMFLMVVALVASAIPEGLPAIMTVTLALGVQRMARRKAIVRRLPAVEALGAVTVICSDKTGTLTRNEMTVQRVVCADARYVVEGAGYAPEGRFRLGETRVDPADAASAPVLAQAIRAGVLCNDARMRLLDDGQWQVDGDPTEGALLVLGSKAEAVGMQQADARTTHVAQEVPFSQDALAECWPRVDVIPFESEHRFMATLHHAVPAGVGEGAPHWICVKGAPEVILDFCATQLTAQGPAPLDVDYWRRMATDLAAQGLRVLALAGKPGGAAGAKLTHADVRQGCTLLALVGIVDPPRGEAVVAVRECHDAGIRVKMITGDHAETARAIGAQLGIGVGKPALTGAEVALLDNAALRRTAGEIDVFARASPEQKLRLVQALQDNGQVVAMTGDGVNDAPALKRADVGVAMGLKGTEAAKEAGDIVLADDNFATIAHAVEEGRAVYDNLRKFILFMLPTNGGEALIVIAAILFQLTLPLTAAQVLWINMVTSSALGLALAFEKAEPGIMDRPPRPPGQPLLDGLAVWRIVLISMTMMAGALGLFLWELQHGVSVEVARTMAVNSVVLAEMFYLLNSRHITDSVLSREGLLGNPYVLLSIAACVPLQLAFTYWPVMQTLMGSAALDGLQWLKVLAAGSLVFFVAELDKLAWRRAKTVEGGETAGR
ncbi:cation-transporting P-type ATPase [Corticibacter populi]|uniref:Cation-transporting P-type ATPase n=1 Tax=Corticibacter populi TaxID=1550736 RepID=A0A3M6QZ43_9BURK|nr:cation-transporting P-type ATPase [Corticibacter populi]RMX07899.1 cation-transporting P-type ATPase [Corticibacter populi]RZS35140.1 P-type E1-E2 ATPase [Corticibacter populi]